MDAIKLKIRHAVPDDLTEIQKLFSETITHVCSRDYTSDQIRVWASAGKNKARWLDKIACQFFLIAEKYKDQQMIGYGSLDHGCHIDFMYVHKDFQGHGVASLILRELEEEAIRNRVREITSDVSKTARPFFEKKGYTVFKEQVHVLQDVEITNFKMKKILG